MNKHYCDRCGSDTTYEKTSGEQSLTRRFWTDSCGQTEVKKEYELCTVCTADFKHAVEQLMAKYEQARQKYQTQNE